MQRTKLTFLVPDTVPIVIVEAARCGYSRCRAELPAPGPRGGRRRTFCRDTRWESDRTCAQMARGERDALDALGLDSGRTAYHLDADRLREHVAAVREPVSALLSALDAVGTRIDEVQAGAVAAVEVANRQVAEAEVARVRAQQERERAEEHTREARERVRRAGEERAEALERAAAAARQALEATEALGTARQVAEQAVVARVAAEERAATSEHRRTESDAAAREAALQAARSAAAADGARAHAQECQTAAEQLRQERAAAVLARTRAEDRAVAATVERDTGTARAETVERAAAADRAALQDAERRLVAAAERIEGERALRRRSDDDRATALAELATARERHTAELRDLLGRLTPAAPDGSAPPAG